MGIQTVISGTGSYIPEQVVSNNDFTQHNFYAEDQHPLATPPTEIVAKFSKITGILERRYASDELTASHIGTEAARKAIAASGVDPETIDQLIVAHNFGNVLKHSVQTAIVPSLATIIKSELGIKNPSCVAYDLIFGCPGWLQGMIHADAFFKAGIAKKALIIGTETLSRVVDIYDRDSMIFSDGAGAAVLEARENSGGKGVLSALAQTYATEEADYINMGTSNYPGSDPNIRFLKMKGRKVYEFAITHVPAAMKACIDQSGVNIKEIKKIFIHQANEKMDEAIIARLYQLYGLPAPENVMPMCIGWLGNSSVATIPTLYDLVLKGSLPEHQLNNGDVVVFASVGAGMNVNAVCYRL